jgi:hypothetical protein
VRQGAPNTPHCASTMVVQLWHRRQWDHRLRIRHACHNRTTESQADLGALIMMMDAMCATTNWPTIALASCTKAENRPADRKHDRLHDRLPWQN